MKVSDFKLYIILSMLGILLSCSAQPEGDPEEESLIPSQLANLTIVEGTSLEVGSLDSDSGYSDKTLTLKNTGLLGATDIAIDLDGSAFQFKGGAYPGEGGDCGETLAGGSTCQMVIRLAQVSSESLSARLSINYYNGFDATKDFSVNLSGVAIPPADVLLSLSEDHLGDVYVGQSKDLEMTLQNNGGFRATDLAIEEINLPFKIKGGTYPGDGGDCGTELAPGASCKILVEFAPSSVGEYNTAFALSLNSGIEDRNLQQNFRGSGVALPVPIISGLTDDMSPTKTKSLSWSCNLNCHYRFQVSASDTPALGALAYENKTSHSITSGTGSFYFHIQAKDQASGAEGAVQSIQLVLDNTKPTLTGPVSSSDNMTESRSPSHSWNSGADETDLKSYEISIGKTAGAQDVLLWTDIGNVLTYQATGLSLVPLESYITSIRAVDVAGNESDPIHSSAWTIPGPPEAITDLLARSAYTTSVELTWSAPSDNGRAITDYLLRYRVKGDSAWISFEDGVSTLTSAEVMNLDDSTEYEFAVIAYNGASSALSNIVSKETAVDDPFFEPDVYKAMNLGGAVESAVVAFEDNTVISLNTTPLVTLNAGETHVFSSSQSDVIEADKPVFVAGRRGSASAGDNFKGNMVWSYVEWSGKNFYFTGTRNKPHIISVYAFEDSQVTIKKGGSVLVDQAVLGGQAHTFSVNDYGGFELVSTGLIIAHMYSSGGGTVIDPKPLLPESTDIVGIPSRTGEITTSAASANITITHSGGTVLTPTISSGSSYSINGVGPGDRGQDYTAEALRIQSDQALVGNSNADADGYCSAPFVPVSRMKKKYAINVAAQYVALVSVLPGSVQVILPDGSSSSVDFARGSENANVPYKVYLTNLPAGTRFVSTVPAAAWYETNSNTGAANNDESVLFGFD